MIVTYNIGILAARLKLTAISSINGGVIHKDICWKITQVDSKGSSEAAEFESTKAQPVFDVAEGDYTIQAEYAGKHYDLGGVFLQQNTETDAVFIFAEFDGDTQDDYFVDYEAEKDFYRRQNERDQQGEKYGAATLPLRDPNTTMQGEMGNQIMSHPLLQNAQFDGVPPDFRPDPSENEAAMQLTLEKQLQNQLGATSAPSPNPMG